MLVRRLATRAAHRSLSRDPQSGERQDDVPRIAGVGPSSDTSGAVAGPATSAMGCHGRFIAWLVFAGAAAAAALVASQVRPSMVEKLAALLQMGRALAREDEAIALGLAACMLLGIAAMHVDLHTLEKEGQEADGTEREQQVDHAQPATNEPEAEAPDAAESVTMVTMLSSAGVALALVALASMWVSLGGMAEFGAMVQALRCLSQQDDATALGLAACVLFGLAALHLDAFEREEADESVDAKSQVSMLVRRLATRAARRSLSRDPQSGERQDDVPRIAGAGPSSDTSGAVAGPATSAMGCHGRFIAWLVFAGAAAAAALVASQVRPSMVEKLAVLLQVWRALAR